MSRNDTVQFTVVATTAGFVVAAIATNYETAKWQKRVIFDPYPDIRGEISWMDYSYSLQMYSEWLEDSIMVRRARGSEIAE
jgi:hypothetical protein